MTKSLTFIVSALCLASFSLADITIDFESLEREDAVFQSVGNSFSEDGFLLSEGSGAQLGNVGTMEPRFSGSTAIAGSSPNSLYVLTRLGGGSFGVESIDLAEFSTTEGIGAPVVVNFTGILTDGGITSQSFELDGTAFAPETFNFDPEFQSIVGLVWLQSNPGHQFDNINVNVIPEPAAGVAILGFMSLIGIHRRRV